MLREACAALRMRVELRLEGVGAMSEVADEKRLRYYGATDWLGVAQLVEGWQSRELLYSFFLRDLLIRYRQVFVGVVWVLLQPLMSTLIFLALFIVLGANRAGDGTSASAWQFAPSLLVGMLMWQMVNNALRDATGALVNYRHVVTKIYFPRMLLPLSCLLCAVFDWMVGSILVPITSWWCGVPLHWSTLWGYALAILLLVTFCFGCILWLSALNAHYRDVGYALPFALQVGMFVSPVVYEASRMQKVLGDRWMVLYEANPIASAIGLARWAAFGQPLPSVGGLALAVAISVVLTLSGLAWFQRANQWMADRI
jgi:lipopolysaccharide transport system permease protein